MIRKHSFVTCNMNNLNENISLTTTIRRGLCMNECIMVTLILYISSYKLPELMGLHMYIENIINHMI